MDAFDREERADVLRAHGASGPEIEELLVYSESGFDRAALEADREYPLDDEPFVAAWMDYAAEAARTGAASVLRRNLIQLRFPISAGMSSDIEYQAAVRRGILPADGRGIGLVDPDGIQIVIHPTAAGRVPVIIAHDRTDFESLVRALARRNEPAEVPPSMGACIIGGYNNWSRVARLRHEWEVAVGGKDESAWQEHFRTIVPRKELYQDRFVLLSTGSYSGTPAGTLGLDAEEWRRLSLVIRLEHECAHYFTKRVFGSMRNSLLDELIADYSGVVAARGRFEPDWFLRFMGAEKPGVWRRDGRLLNYRGNPPLSDAAFVVLQRMVRTAARTLAEFDALVRENRAPGVSRSLDETARSITAIATAGLERLAVPEAARRLYASYHEFNRELQLVK